MMRVPPRFLRIITASCPLLITITAHYRRIHIQREVVKLELLIKPPIQMPKYSLICSLCELLKMPYKCLVPRHPLIPKYPSDCFIMAGYFHMLKSVCSAPYPDQKLLNQLLRVISPV